MVNIERNIRKMNVYDINLDGIDSRVMISLYRIRDGLCLK
jgi:hypothetical protein